jgi:hypothetical protein
VVKFEESGRIVETLGDISGVSHPMVTSMREHKGWLYVGGILNNRIGRYRSPVPIRAGPARIVLGKEAMIFDPILDIFRGKAVTIPPMDGASGPTPRWTRPTPCWRLLRRTTSRSTARDLLFSSGSDVLSLAPGSQSRSRSSACLRP